MMHNEETNLEPLAEEIPEWILPEPDAPAEISPEEITADLLEAVEEPAVDAPEELTPEAETEPEVACVTGDTIRLDSLEGLEGVAPASAEIIPPEEVTEEAEVTAELFSENWEPEYDQPMGDFPPAPEPKSEPIVFRPRQKLRELKKKLIAGPEKRYYDLSELGLGKLQLGIALNLLIVLLCAGAAVLLAGGGVPDNRMRLLIFSQMLALLMSALTGSYCLIDGAADLFKARFSMNTMLLLTFLACAVDVVFCLKELRVPCCAPFSLEVAMALWQRYEQRNTEMGQMDTMRKATRLNSVVKVPDYYEGRPGLLRGEGQVEDFMDHYNETTGPEKVRAVYAFVSFLLCIGIAVFAGLRHGVSMAVRIFAMSLLVATPASFFVALSRPMAVLERRLHMSGTVLCGWRGVKALCGKAVFPLKDTDIFPQGAAKLNGVKFYGERNPEDVIAYAAALIRVNGGGLVPVFKQLLESHRGNVHEVVNFRDYPQGGIGGEVCDEPVLLGTLKFLQDMGVEVPEGTMVNQAVYCAIDGEFCGVFAITYAKARTAAAGMVSLCGYRTLSPVLLCDDFMLDEGFLRSKFSVHTKRVIFPDRETRTALLSRTPDEDAVSLALTTQDGLASYAYAVTGARMLRTANRLGLAIHMFGGILGMLCMLVLGYLGASYLLTPLNALLYQLVWLIPGLLATNWTKVI